MGRIIRFTIGRTIKEVLDKKEEKKYKELES